MGGEALGVITSHSYAATLKRAQNVAFVKAFQGKYKKDPSYYAEAMYHEIIFFETDRTLDDFKGGEFALAAQATAVAVKAGASANAKYNNGVAIFTVGQKGLMVEASVGGQKFTFEDLETAQDAMAKD